MRLVHHGMGIVCYVLVVMNHFSCYIFVLFTIYNKMSNIPPPSYGLAYLTLSQAYKYFVAIGSLAGTISASIAAVLAGNVTVGGNLTVSGTGTQQLGGSGAL